MYDFMNRLVRRTTASGDIIDIAYSADGDRVEKRVNGVSIHYLVDRNNLTGYAQVIEELDSSLTVIRSYTYGLDLIAQDQLTDDGFGNLSWQQSYYLYDGLGSVRGLANSSGLVTDAYFYDAWGNLINTAGADTANSYLFTGEQYDAHLGMYFLRARYLNPETGRFHTLDTYEGRNGEPATLHKYLYAHANPVMFTDPSGNAVAAGLMGLQLGTIISGKLAATLIIGVSYAVYYLQKEWTISTGMSLEDGFHMFMHAASPYEGGYRYDITLEPRSLVLAKRDKTRLVDGFIEKNKEALPSGLVIPVAKHTHGQYKFWESKLVGKDISCGETNFEKRPYRMLPGPNCTTWTVWATGWAHIISHLPFL